MKYSLRSVMRFSIRDLFLITVVVAILVAWWLDHWRAAVDREKLIKAFRDSQQQEIQRLQSEWADRNRWWELEQARFKKAAFNHES